jgi:hypothetical protein
MQCASCTSSHQAELGTEINIHVRGRKRIEDPGVLIFPRLLVCLDCGFSCFIASENELACLAGDQSASKSIESQSADEDHHRQV